MGRVRIGYLIENFFKRFLRVHMGRVRMGYLIENFFEKFPKIRIGYF